MAQQKFFDRLFPVKFDFYEMLSNQARMNSRGIDTLYKWLTDVSGKESGALMEDVKKADEIRMDMEKNLIQAFSTPFDRGDIYSISVAMDKVIEYAKSTLLSMEAYEVISNDTITSMIGNLKKGADLFSEAIDFLKTDPLSAELSIAGIRETHTAIEQLYRDGMTLVFKSNDPINAFKLREVYHHIKDASSNLEDSADILHRIVVRLT